MMTMIRRKPLWGLLAAGAVAAAALGVAAPSLATPPTSCGTNSNSGPGQQIGENPAIAGAANSTLHVNCVFATADLSTAFTIHDFENAQYHQGAARQFALTANTAIGSKILVSSTARFSAASDVGHTVASVFTDGTPLAGIPARAFIASVQSPTQATMNIAATVLVPSTTRVKLDNSRARQVKDGVVTTGCVVTSATAFFSAADLGTSLIGPSIPDYRTITAVTSATQVSVGSSGCTAGSAQAFTIGQQSATTTARQVGDATQTATTISSASAKFAATDLGLPVTGAGIPANAYISAVPAGGATATITPGTMTANATAHAIVIGLPSVTAPTNGFPVLTISAIIDLNPVVTGGGNACSANKPEAGLFQAGWMNPGSFLAAPTFGAPPATGKLIAQLLFKTATATFTAYVVESPAGDSAKAVPHYDVKFPFMPITLGSCPSPNVVPVQLGFNVTGTAANQLLVPVGVGRPGSLTVRSLGPNGGVAKSTTAVFKSDVATAPKNWSFTGTCTMAAIPVSDFHCGQ